MKLTKAQNMALRYYAQGGTLDDPARVWAPIRRLVARGLIVKTGRVYRGKQYYTLSPAGRAALESSP